MSKLSSLHIVETNRAYGIENHIFILPTYNKWGEGIHVFLICFRLKKQILMLVTNHNFLFLFGIFVYFTY